MIEDFVNDSDRDQRSVILFTGDLVLDEADPDHWLSGIAPALRQADIAIGHLEAPHTRRGVPLDADVPAPGADPKNLEALARAGFTAVTLAGNHIADCGPEGIADTIDVLDRLRIAHTGAGKNLPAARQPAFLRSAERSIALLSYNCVGPEAAWADTNRAGCAYLPLETEDGSPVSPTAPLSRVRREAVEILNKDIGDARLCADLVIVAMHKGIVHTPAVLAPYERTIAHAAIDAGADVVVGHHAHIIRGIEFYRGKPIFHGLGNGCVVTRALSPDQDHPRRAEWARRRKELFGFEPDPAYDLAPFHPQAVNAMLGCLLWRNDGSLTSGLIPVHVEPPGRPVLAEGNRRTEICDYVARITRDAGLPDLEMHAGAQLVVVS